MGAMVAGLLAVSRVSAYAGAEQPNGDVVADRRHLLTFDSDSDHHSSHSTYTHSPTYDHHSSHSAHTLSPTTEGHDVHGLGHDEHDSHTLGPGETRSPTLFPHQLSAEHAQGLAITNVVITILNIVFEAINIGFTGADLLTRPFGALTSFGFAHKNKKLLKTLGASKSGLLILGAQQALHSSITTQLETIGHEVGALSEEGATLQSMALEQLMDQMRALEIQLNGMPVGTLAGDTMSADMRARNENLLSRANSILQELQTIQSAQTSMSEQATQLQLLTGQAFELENDLAAMLQGGGDGTVSANAGDGMVTASTGMDDRRFLTKLVDPFGLVFKKKDKKMINLDPFKHVKALHRKIFKKDKKDGFGAFPVIGALGTEGGVVASGDQAAAAPAFNPFAWMQPAAAAGETDRAGALGLNADVAAAAPAPAPVDPTEQARLNYLFTLFDADGSGGISHAELKAAVQSTGQPLTDQEIDEAIQIADKNQDGEVSIDELGQLIAQM